MFCSPLQGDFCFENHSGEEQLKMAVSARINESSSPLTVRTKCLIDTPTTHHSTVNISKPSLIFTCDTVASTGSNLSRNNGKCTPKLNKTMHMNGVSCSGHATVKANGEQSVAYSNGDTSPYFRSERLESGEIVDGDDILSGSGEETKDLLVLSSTMCKTGSHRTYLKADRLNKLADRRTVLQVDGCGDVSVESKGKQSTIILSF